MDCPVSDLQVSVMPSVFEWDVKPADKLGAATVWPGNKGMGWNHRRLWRSILFWGEMADSTFSHET